MRIWLTKGAILTPSYYDFISTYSESLTVKELMKKRNIVPHCISLHRNAAYFVEFKDGDNPYNVRKYSLLQVSQKDHSKYCYIVPLKDFISYCDDLDVASRHIVWLSHSARCGSTLWGQIFNALPGWNVVSESLFFTHSLLYERPFGDVVTYSKTKQFAQLVVAGFKFHVSRFPDDHGVLFKMSTHDCHLLSPVHKYFKNMVVLHAYRNALDSSKSWYNSVIGFDVILSIKYLFGRALDIRHRSEYIALDVFSLYTQSLFKSMENLDTFRPQGLFEWYLFLWCSFNDGIRDAERDGIVVKYLKYESLMEDKETYIRKLFDYLGICQDQVSVALEATEVDSQAGTFLSHETRKNNKRWIRTDENARRATSILNTMGYPDLDTDLTFENTL